MRTAFVFALLLAGCNGGGTYVPPDTDTESDTDTDTDADSDTDTDTDPPGTDNDGDGWTVEEGDCNDDDIWMNPAWDEKEDDDKDNDCDGWVDEEFQAINVLEVNLEGGPPTMHTISPFGDIMGSMTFSGPLYAQWMVDDPDGDGWWFGDYYQMGLYYADSSGNVTEIWTDAETEYEPGTEPLGYYGLARHPSGYWLMTGADRLWRITDEGAADVIAEWACLEGEEGTTDICPVDVTVDRFTGEVFLFGYFGGFGTWSEESGLEVLVYDDPENPPILFGNAGIKESSGALFALGTDAADGRAKVFKWNEENLSFDVKCDSLHQEYLPTVDFAVEQDSGDIYYTANAAWDSSLWRMVADGSYAADLKIVRGESNKTPWWATTIVFSHD